MNLNYENCFCRKSCCCGPTGPTGATGTIGEAVPMGAVGATGATGLKGADGTMGVSGNGFSLNRQPPFCCEFRRKTI